MSSTNHAARSAAFGEQLGQLDTRLMRLAAAMEANGATDEAAEIRTGCTYVRESWDGADSHLPLEEALENIAIHAQAMLDAVRQTRAGGQYHHLTGPQG